MKYRITERNGVYTAMLPLALADGRVLLIKSSASVADTMRDFGQNPYQVGDIFGDIGNFFKKVTKSKAIRSVVKAGKSIIRSPITKAAAGAIGGPGAYGALDAADKGIAVVEQITKGNKAARKFAAATMRVANKKRRRRSTLGKMLTRAKKRRMSLASRKLAAALRGKKVKKISRRKPSASDFLVNVHFA